MDSESAAKSAALRIAQRAIEFDQAQRYEEAIYCYGEAADRIIHLLQSKKISTSFRKNAIEYVERAEFLKSDLPRLLQLSQARKPPSLLLLEKVEFVLLKAQLSEETQHYPLAIELYSEATQLCIQAGSNCEDEQLQVKLRTFGNIALERLENLKRLEQQIKIQLLTENLPNVPVDELSKLNVSSSSSPDRPSPTSESPVLPHKSSGLTKEELAVLAVTSNINGRKYVPFLSVDLKEKFNYTIPFSDKDGKLSLTEKQKKRIKAWLRPHEIFPEPKVIGNIDSGTIKQTVISDCSFVASLSITARYEKRFGKQIVTSIIYPQNRLGQPVYNPSGKYMVKFHINGVWRKVVIDDFLPTGENLELLCSHSQEKGELWVSLLEKAYLKVMGGYDFPGSNSNIDLHALTGWIPDRIAIKTENPSFDRNQVFEKLLSRFHRGDCLITLATGKLSEQICERAGLVECHAYAVLDLRRIDGKRLLMVKNPWTHLRWKGRYSENDSINWTPSLRKALDYDPNQAKVKDDADPKPLYEGTRINSPHYLCQMVIDDPGPQKYTLVVAQYEKMKTIYYTLRVYSSCNFTLSPIKCPYITKKTVSNGCNCLDVAKNNPLFHVSLEECSDENHILVDLKGPKQYSVGFEILQVSSPRNKPFERKESGVYRPGYTVLVLEKVPAGCDTIRGCFSDIAKTSVLSTKD
ncbi:calpain family cysteine protease [Necator americanus]|uniref:Calpain family cysteine protease n=1 Tax=Necator americanus TaxID=51031 RepID=W2T575_NECAM|nr:calpain family cysteine protease [Necator americanus]ETN76311.1 calpain family cysteine protease [Necator americanus]